MKDRATKVRYSILLILFIVTTLNYADRSTLSIAGSAVQKDLGLDAVQMGFIFSAFAWAYVVGQIPGGWLLDRYGSKRIYAASIFLWSLFTAFQGMVGFLAGGAAMVVLFLLRFAVGLAESPAFPGNSRVAAAWFPANERATAAGIFTSAQYFSTVLFGPLMGWVTYTFGWPAVFISMGLLGIAMSVVWLKSIYSPRSHPRINEAELQLIQQGGGLVDMDEGGFENTAERPSWARMKQLLGNRMMLGTFLGQYFINTLSYFFLTWFPVYLVQERGMSILKAGFVASIPAVCGFIGGVLGGMFSDWLLRRGHSITFARKLPLVMGMLLSMTMVACNVLELEWAIIAVMATAYFGKGFGAIGWAVIADAAPKQVAGLAGGLFNAAGNIAGITTPIIIGYIVRETGSFAGALAYVSVNAVAAIVCYLVVVGKIRRLELADLSANTAKA